jgi:hypothetical protein
MEPSQIHQTIAQQIDHTKPDDLKPGVDVGMQAIDDCTLAVVMPKAGTRVDVRYDAGPDTYTLTRSERVGEIWVSTKPPMSDVYCDQLGELIFGSDAKPWSQPFGGIVDMDTGETIAEF